MTLLVLGSRAEEARMLIRCNEKESKQMFDIGEEKIQWHLQDHPGTIEIKRFFHPFESILDPCWFRFFSSHKWLACNRSLAIINLFARLNSFFNCINNVSHSACPWTVEYVPVLSSPEQIIDKCPMNLVYVVFVFLFDSRCTCIYTTSSLSASKLLVAQVLAFSLSPFSSDHSCFSVSMSTKRETAKRRILLYLALLRCVWR